MPEPFEKRIEHAIEDYYACRRTGHIGDHAAEVAEIVMTEIRDAFGLRAVEAVDALHRAIQARLAAGGDGDAPR